MCENGRKTGRNGQLDCKTDKRVTRGTRISGKTEAVLLVARPSIDRIKINIGGEEMKRPTLKIPESTICQKYAYGSPC